VPTTIDEIMSANLIRPFQTSLVIAITIPATTNTQIATWVQMNSFGILSKAIVSSMPERLSPALKAVSDAVLAIASQLSVDEVLQRLVDSARELAGARYAALGIPDGAGGFTRFLVAGMSDELVASMGPLPRTHGMLGAMLQASGAYRTDDIHEDPRFRGWWPRQHPDMRSFLGVPIVAREEVIGAFYLTEKEGAACFDHGDQELIELLAAHAAIAITNARLYERSRELSILSERNRMALELHDVVSQKLFSLNLSANSAATLLDRDPQAAHAQLDRVRELAREALAELRSLILGLRPADLAHDGLEGALRKEVEMLRRVHGVEVDLRAEAGGPDTADPRDVEVLRIAHEALHNAVRHAAATRVTVRLGGADQRLTLEVTDDGIGFDPADPELRSRHLGLTSMEERARELGGTLVLRSSPGTGTTVRLELAGNGR
jgi:signal transduction histidine kinase